MERMERGGEEERARLEGREGLKGTGFAIKGLGWSVSSTDQGLNHKWKRGKERRGIRREGKVRRGENVRGNTGVWRMKGWDFEPGGKVKRKRERKRVRKEGKGPKEKERREGRKMRWVQFTNGMSG